MKATSSQQLEGVWPPAFSETFLEQAAQLLTEHAVVLVVGSVGTNRHELVDLLTRSGPSQWPEPLVTSHEYGTLERFFSGTSFPADLTPAQAAAQLEEHLVADTTPLSEVPVFVVPDADLCDEQSVAVLVDLAERGFIRLVATVGPGGPERRDYGQRPARIDLAPLDSDTVSALLAARFRARPHPTVVSMIEARSLGAYGVLRDVAELASTSGELLVESGVLVIGPGAGDNGGTGPGFDDFAALRVLEEGHPALDVLRLVGLIPRIALADAEEIFTREELQAAEIAQVVNRDAEVLVVATPFEGLSISTHMSLDERRDLWDRVSPHLQRTAQDPTAALPMAQWVLSMGQTLDPELATRAISQANREVRYHVAIALAHAVDPEAVSTSRILMEQIYARHNAGDVHGAKALMQSTDPATVADDDLLEFLYSCATTLDESHIASLTQQLLAELEGECTPSRRATIELAASFNDMFEASGDAAERRVRALLLAGHLSPANQAMTNALLGVMARHQGRAAQAVEFGRASRDLLDPIDAASYHRDFAYESLIWSHVADGNALAAADVLREYGAPGAAYGNFGRLGTAIWGVLEYGRGDLASGLACAESFLGRIPASDPTGIRGWAEAMTAQVLLQAGRPDRGEELLEASTAHGAIHRATHDLERNLAQAGAYDLLCDPERALTLLERTYSEALQRGLSGYAIEAAALCVQIDGPHRLTMLQDVTRGRDDLTGRFAWWKKFGDLMAANDMRGLVAFVDELRSARAAVFAAEVAQFTLDVARRASDMTPSERTHLTAIAQPMHHRHVSR